MSEKQFIRKSLSLWIKRGVLQQLIQIARNVKNILAVTDQHKQLWQGSITKSRDGQRSRDELIVLGVLEDTNIQRPK
ncbi:unnamed protein product [Onchocerca flexuosa]|uniref:Transposase n=1 Tax=Onchocerca flexuosa TaxID=387005 RepID=A0A183GZ10_9BILA|nr:unnamed protein product [Onchocerca flexuosa]